MAAALTHEVQGRETPDDSDRESVRSRWLGEIPSWYSPWAHLAFPSVVGLGLIAGAVASVHGLRPWQLFVVPLVWVLSNAVEWRTHKNVLHKRFWPLGELYERHTPNHHRVFVTADMALRSAREFKFVLLPFYGIVAIFMLNAPITLALVWAGQHNLAALYVATTMGYVLSYEWLHLAYHLPADSFIGRLGLVRVLRHHHAVHHNPSLMQKWNFNVTIPLWDWVRQTIYRPKHS
jgi:hypothetical protein